MKTKFTKIVFVKEREKKNKEAQIIKIDSKRKEVYKKIEDLTHKINSTKLPTDGNFAMLNLVKNSLNVLREEKKELEKYYSYLGVELENAKRSYKIANIEYEKIKHLDDLEKESIYKKIKKLEQLQSDEIATILFANRSLKE